MLVAKKKLKNRGELAVSVLVLLFLIAGCVGLWTACMNLFSCTVSMTSMYPTLREQQVIALSAVEKPSRGDIVVVDMFGYVAEEVNYVKRVIGQGEDRVRIETADGEIVTIRVNGETEGYASDPMKAENMSWSSVTEEWRKAFVQNGWVEFTVPAGELFILGDNRNVSKDSRWFGCVKSADVIGVAVDIGPWGGRINTVLTISKFMIAIAGLALVLFGENLLFTGEEPYDD